MSKHFKRLARRTGEGVQYGTLVWRRAETLQILLVTSRETRRWTVPKGWPEKKLSPAAAAAREAEEEAGVHGPTGSSIGTYRYDKRMRDGGVVRCTVEVFPLEARQVDDHWHEAAERERAWFAPTQAALLVQEPELKALILGFEPPSDG